MFCWECRVPDIHTDILVSHKSQTSALLFAGVPSEAQNASRIYSSFNNAPPKSNVCDREPRDIQGPEDISHLPTGPSWLAGMKGPSRTLSIDGSISF